MWSLDVTLSPVVGIIAMIYFAMWVLKDVDKKSPSKRKGNPSEDEY